MHQLPDTGYLRLPHIIGNAKAKPPIPAVFPVGKSTWWAGVKSGRYPQPAGPRDAHHSMAVRGHSRLDRGLQEGAGALPMGKSRMLDADGFGWHTSVEDAISASKVHK